MTDSSSSRPVDEPWTRAGGVALGAVTAVVVGAIGTASIHWITTLHHG